MIKKKACFWYDVSFWMVFLGILMSIYRGIV
nr:MAG TPA: hypothetical protein [Caudoviricetes sp.]DAE79979.1 MAG TPA: hypothetical protein [Caudoviricetes sp.]